MPKITTVGGTRDMRPSRKERLDDATSKNPVVPQNEVYKVFTGPLRYSARPVVQDKNVVELSNSALGHTFRMRVGKETMSHSQLADAVHGAGIEMPTFKLLLKQV